MDLSIIIVSWNTRDPLAQCLESVRRELGTLPLSAETWVIDNASQDGSQAMLESEFPWVRCIFNADNPGFAAGNNQGLRAAGGRLLLLLNSDTVLRPGSLAALLAVMDAQPGAGAAGARLLNADGSLQVSCYPEPTLLREAWRMFHLDRFRKIGVYDMQTWPVDAARPVDCILGACMLLRRVVVEQVGEMDEGYFMYSEEIDWCLRIRRAGWQIVWEPRSEIIHLGGQSTRQVRSQMFQSLYRAKIRYFRKHHGRWSARLYKGIIFAAAAFRVLLSPLSLGLPAPRRSENLQLAGHYFRLLRSLPGY